ncbi:YegP family protein [Frigoribacterium sp. R86507]|uniref:YegP family protein n=1 Tax=Frigoribacterium sp. R86507 TaxID=3093850 RepID=UPI0037C9A421
MAGTFVVTQDASGEYRFDLTTGNGEVLASSGGYKQKGSAMNGIDALRRTAVDAVVDDRTDVPVPGHAD